MFMGRFETADSGIHMIGKMDDDSKKLPRPATDWPHLFPCLHFVFSRPLFRCPKAHDPREANEPET